MRASALGFLLHGTPGAAADALSAAGGGALLPPPKGDDDSDESGQLSLDDRSLPGPHPVLRFAFVHGCGQEAVSALRDALTDWDALEEEICDAARVPRPRRGGGGGGGGSRRGEEETDVRSAAQSVADALAALLEDSDPRLAATASAAAALGLIADLVSESRATASAALLEAALRQVALGGGGGGGGGAAGRPEAAAAAAGTRSRGRDRDAREDLFVHLLSAAVALYGPSASASPKEKKQGTAAAKGGGGGAGENPSPAPPLDLPSIRTLARSAGFRRAEAAALDAARDAGGALDVLLLASGSDFSFRAFEYADRVLEEAAAEASASPSSRKRWAQLRSAVVERAPALAAAYGGAAARLVARHFPEDHAAVMCALSRDEPLAFAYLRGAYAAAAARVAPGGGGGGIGGETATTLASSGSPSDDNYVDSSSTTAASRAAAARLLADASAGDTYVRLLCSRDPGGVLPFLKSRAAYSAEAALDSARLAGVADAQAFLLERLGDVAGAASILAAALTGGGEALLLEAGGGEGRESAEHRHQQNHNDLRHRHCPRLLSPKEALLSALDDALGLCKRGAADLPFAAAAALWMTVVDALADLLRRAGSSESEGGSEKDKEASSAATSLFAFALDAAVAAAATSVPLRSIGERMLERHGAAPLREFRATLAGVLAGGRREAALAAAAARLSSSDAARAESAARAAAVRASSSRPESGEEGNDGGREDVVIVDYGGDGEPRRRQRKPRRRFAAPSVQVSVGGGMPFGLSLAPSGERSLLGETAARFSVSAFHEADDDEDPGSPLYRGGVDVGYLMLHDVSLHDVF